MTEPTTVPSEQLPATIRAYLTAHGAGDPDTAIRSFTTNAVVVDEGHSFRGAEEVLGFLRHAGGQYTYTSELIGAQRLDDARWIAVVRLEGSFPGGVAELRYRFTLVDDLIAQLVIAP